MKLTKKQQSELIEVYETWLKSYLNGDVKTYDSFLADDYHFVGSTNGEEYLNRKDTTAFFNATADQLAGKAELRNLKRTIEELEGGLILITDLADAYVASEPEWVYYSRFRFTSLMKETKEGWRFIYQHFSAPDTKAQEGETLGTLQITKENEELRDAIKRRTVELEHKTKELAIEAALERVRAVAMGMQKPDDLMEICKVVYGELQALGFSELRNTLIDTFVDEENYFIDYDYSEFTGGTSSKIPYSGNPVVEQYIKDIRKPGEAFSEITVKGEQLEAWKKFRRDNGEVEDSRLDDLKALYYYKYSIGPGGIGISTYSRISNEKQNILHRFRNVFDLAYKRYNDITKAEAQARESQIELGLERVRARAMAMQTSDELSDLVDTVFKELTKLDFEISMCIINIIDESTLSNMVWGANPETGKPPASYYMKFEDYPFHHAMMKGYKERDAKFIYVIEGDEKKNYDEYLFNLTEFSKMPPEAQAALRAMKRYVASFSFSNFGGLQTVGAEPLSEAKLDILARFGKVFDLTYTRFNDLLKAEAQTRNAQIDLAVERVRAKALAMHNSKQILEVVATLKNEMLGLEIPGVSAATIYLEEEGYIRMWDLTSIVSSEDDVQLSIDVKFKLEETDTGLYIRKVWKGTEKYFLVTQEPKDMPITLNWLKQYYPELAAEAEEFLNNYSWKILWHPIVQLANGKMSVDILDHDPPVEMESIMLKMGAAFDLAYKRFLDLKNAEAQTRESQIELSLEKIRSRTMAMQQSDELGQVADVLFKELNKLVENLWSCGFVLCEKGSTEDEWWLSAEGGYVPAFRLPNVGDATHNNIYKAWERGEIYHTEQLEGEALQEHYDWLMNIPVAKSIFEEMLAAGYKLPVWQKLHCAYFSYGYLVMITEVPCSEEQIFKRFAQVFDQTYTRFLDLQKAEAQAREAKIEAALEKVRSHTMAMQKSDELQDASLLLFQQVQALGVPPFACGFNIWDEDKQEATAWMGSVHGLQPPFKTSSKEDIYLPIYEASQRGESLFVIEQQGKELEKHYDYLSSIPVFRDVIKPNMAKAGISFPTYQIVHCAFFTQGYLMFISYEPVPAAHEIFKRFAKVFEQTYTRFLDLEKAEAQAREAQIETALERVRARAMAMHDSNELNEVALELRNQMGLLGQKELEVCAIHLYEEDDEFFESWGAMRLSNENGEIHQGMARFPKSGIKIIDEMMQMYTAGQKDYVLVNEKEKVIEWFDTLKKYAPVAYAAIGQTFEKIPHEKLKAYWAMSDFSGGSMLMVSQTFPDENSRNLLRRSSNVFDLAYRRFKDLKKAEAQAEQARLDLIQIQKEKKRAEEALTDLQLAQKQLIQSEKMASLGELTAGIAHEIQNPLNFVNNFSEVSKELLDEMKEAIDKGDSEEAKEIANDIIQNLEKINHHGKRADGIVKGMLQHSRSSNATKEATDINALADEYLRLAYHGLRAKDKSFNATIKTVFAEGLEKVNIIPQDIGRVILNLITNAFYVVDEKKKLGSDSNWDENYEPTVTVTTKKLDGNIELSVEDNGNGIPEKVLDKIFQPFFTTKPTGQGTGLGLSLAYDIVKAHGGELKVETVEGEGTVFCIVLYV